MKKILTFPLATLGLTTACGQDNFENNDVQGFAELVSLSAMMVVVWRKSAPSLCEKNNNL